MFFTPWLRSVSRRIGLSKFRRRKYLRSKQRQLLLHGPFVVSARAEELEERCVLTPPSFISVSPNTGVFLSDGSTLTEAPRELTFQFSPGQTLSAATLGAIHVVGAGYDGAFTPANVVTDLSTNGGAVLRIGAQRLGPDDNGAQLDVNVAATGTGPSVALNGGILTLTLDSSTGTTAQNLIDFAATNATAKRLLSVSLIGGSASTNLASGPAGLLGTFQLSGAGAASAINSFGANSLKMLFTANQPGLGGDDISLQINRLNLSGTDPAPRISVVGKRIEITLNENATTPTTAQTLADAINTNSAASLLVRASIPVGLGTTNLSSVIDGTLIRLAGTDRALTASTVSGFQTNTSVNLLMQFAAKTQGLSGNDISLVFNQANLSSSNAAPTVSVSGNQITVTLNNNAAAKTKASDLITALTGNALITAKLVQGLGTTDLTTLANGTIVPLGGADPAVAPGYRGLESNNREVTYRFATALDNDTYRFEVIGTGSAPLTNVGGEAVNSGQDTFMNVALDLGATVTGVVPQPVLRQQFITVNSVANLIDGDTITVDPGTGSSLFTFEFNSTGGVRTGNTAIAFTSGQATSIIAASIATAINTATLANPDISATSSSATVTVVGGAFDVRVKSNLLTTSALTTRAGGIEQRRNLVNVYFNEDSLDATLAQDIRFYQLVDTNGSLATGDDRILMPTSLVYDGLNHTTTLDFGTPLANATYKLLVGESEESNNLLATAVNVGTVFATTAYQKVAFIGDAGGNLDYDLYKIQVNAGASITATVVPGASLNSAVRLFNSSGSAIAFDNGGVVVGAQDQILNFNPGVAGIYYVGVSNSVNASYTVNNVGTTAGGTTGSYRVTISTTAGFSAGDNNSSYATATSLGTLGVGGQTFQAAIDTTQSSTIPLPPPAGGSDEPGHREIPAESHGAGAGTTPSAPGALGTVSFSFPVTYGVNAQGDTLFNEITSDQKDRAREIFEIYASLYGFEVAEVTSGGIGIVTGDPRAVQPTIPVGAIGGIAGGGVALMNSFLNFTAQDNQFGGSWMGIALHEIGHAIGLGHSYDIRSVQGNGTAGEDQYPGNNDIVHGRRINPNSGTDIDLYQFAVAQTGTFSAEIVAERLATSSLLNSALRLYRQELTGTKTLIAQNDDYFSNDAFIEMELTPGTYFLGVSSTGNTDYDPTVSDTGFNGTSDGTYQLQLKLAATGLASLQDITGQKFDGDADKQPGGMYEFAFQSANTIYVDKTVVTNLASPMTATQTTAQVNDLTMFPSMPGFNIRIENEVMRVMSIDTVNKILGVDRSINGTVDNVTHGAGQAVRSALENGSLANPYGLISLAVAAATPGTAIRIVGNGGIDNDILTVQDNRSYLLGQNDSFAALEDGSTFQIPRNVVVQIDSGAVIKSQSAVIDAGTSAVGIDRSGSALQVLGTPRQDVYFTTYENDLIGGDSDGITDGATAGDWGGLVFRKDSDFVASDAATNRTDRGIFLNYVNHADISYGGGQVSVDSVVDVFAPIYLVTARPTVAFNTVTNSAGPAMSGNPDSFDDSRHRIGPDLHGNLLTGNTLNGMFIRITTLFGQLVDRLTTTARLDDTDIVYLITENLEMVGNPGGPLDGVARPSGRLAIDPGVVVKLSGSRIEAMRGNSHLIAEGTSVDPVIFTSVNDDRFGSGGTFDTGNNQSTVFASPGDWGGLMFNAVSRASIDHAYIAYGGGQIPIEGGLADFNTIEAHHGARLRVADSTFENNADGVGSGGTRNGRGTNSAATIFVRQVQPIIVNNVFQNNAGSVVNINANAMLSTFQRDTGRSTGALDDFEQFADNHGPLVRLNRMTGNTINGMEIRGDVLTTESIWDDTDMVHVLRSEIKVDQHHTYSGIRLQSNPGESLVVKLQGANAGFTADGILLDIDDRIGGTVQVVGQPGFPVVMTSLRDDSTGASLDPDGFPQTDTNNDGTGTQPTPGDWRSLMFLKNSNDRNVRVEMESERANNSNIEINNNQGNAQFLGELAPQHVNTPTADPLGQTVRLDGDDNRPLGFEVHGFISADAPGDVDVYSFKATAGTEIWIDLDRTRSASLDPVVELVQSNGTVLARARYNSATKTVDLTGSATSMTKFGYDGGDFYTFNYHDTGFRTTLAGTAGTVGTYFVRVRSNQASVATLNSTLDGGLTRGEYQLQIRLRQVDEKPGSVVRYADIRYAVTGIDVEGLPAHSPLLSEGTETTGLNGPSQTPQPLGNLLNSDRNTISVGGELGSGDDIDFYQYNSDYAATVLGNSIQVIGGLSGGGKTWSTVFDLDYADGLTRGDTTMIVYDASGRPILIGRESQVQDDQPGAGQANDLDDLTRGTVGKLDPFIGPVQMPTGNPGSTINYLVAVSSNRFLNNQLDQNYDASPTNMLARLEPVNSEKRIIEDHIGYQGYGSNGQQVDPSNTVGLFTDLKTSVGLSSYVRPFDFGDVVLYVNRPDDLYTVNPLYGQVTTTIDNNLDQTNNNNGATDIVMRSDGRLWAYRRSNTNNGVNTNNNTSGALVELESGVTGTNLGNFISNTDDGILSGSPAAGNFGNDVFEQVTNSDDVDALAFQRNDVNNYQLYYSVRENGVSATTTGANTFNSKLYRADPNTGSAARSNPLGIQGDIQLSGTNPASSFLNFFDGTNGGNIAFQTRAQGTQANGVQLVIQRTGGATQVVGAGNGIVTVNVNFNFTTGAGTTSLQTVVDVINASFSAQQILTAVATGNAGTLVTQDRLLGTAPATGGTNDSSGRRIQGNVTGLAYGSFSGGILYGVTSGEGTALRGSQLIRITPGYGGGGGTATIIRDFTSQGIGTTVSNGFQGLALGPQNVSGGIYANTLFAVTSDGRLVALSPTTGNGVIAFDSNSLVQTISESGPPTAGFFTLDFDSGTGPQTTDPIAYNAPASVSNDEIQNVDVVAYNGSYTLSFVNNLSDTTSLQTAINNSQTTFVVEDVTGLPTVGNFVIRIDAEEMIVTNVNVATRTLTVAPRGGVHGTAAVAHINSATVFEVLTTNVSNSGLGVDAVVTNIPVVDTTSFPITVGSIIRIGSEDMSIVAVNPASFDVVRGVNGTTPAVHAAGDIVYRVINTAVLPYNSTAVEVDTALTTALGNAGITVAAGDIVTTVGPTGGTPTIPGGATPVTIQFTNSLATSVVGRRDLFALTADTRNLEGDEQQQIALGATFSGGTFRLSFNGSANSVPINYNETDPLVVQAALESLSTIGVGNVIVSGGPLPGTSMQVQFVGALQDSNVPAIVMDSALLRNNERQQVLLLGGPTGGTFRLAFNGDDSLDIAFNDSAAAVQASLEGGIPALIGNINVTNGPLPGAVIITFIGTLADQNVNALTLNTNGLTGGTNPTAVITTLSDGNQNGQITTTRAGSPVSVPISTTQDGNLSVYDALVGLANIGPNDISVTGGDLPGIPVGVTFIGQYAGVTVNQMTANNSGLIGGAASVATSGTLGDGMADSFVINTGLGGATGLAFSPLDINLWHPTMRRTADAGHGINLAYDNSRTPSAESRTITGGNDTKNQSEANGGAKFYFGLEQYRGGGGTGAGNANNNYFAYESSQGQLGVLNNNWQLDLTSNANIRNNFNVPGGAYGSMTTNSFDLTSSTGTQTNRDRPTMYFDYFLASQDTNVFSANSFMRDSARVFISTTGGTTWQLLTTNDSPLSGAGVPSGGASTETPYFVSHSRLANNSDARQRIQTLFDNSGSWRQARVDMSDYIGMTGLVLRFDFSTAGTIIDAGLTNNDPTLVTPQDDYGDLESSGRSTNNAFEGFYIDDIVIGWTERGEMITGASADQDYFSVPQPPASLNLPQEILSGPYQVEIRRGFEYGGNIDKKTPLISIANTFDTNSRFIPGYDLLASSPPVSDNFDAPATTVPTFNPANGWIANSSGSNAPWVTAALSGTGGSQAAISTQVDDSEFSAMQITQTASAVSFNYKVTTDVGDQFRVYLDDINDLGGPIFTSGDTAGVFLSKTLSFSAGVHTLIFVYQKDGSDGVDAVANANERAVIDDVVFTGLSNTFIRGDRNLARDQGHFQIESNIIRNSSTVGIDVGAGPRAGITNFPTPGSPINFQTQNAERLAPSVTIVNNVVANSGTVGIRFGGDPDSAGNATDPASAVPFGKVVNNTIYGTATRAGIGIQVHDSASPTLMNNIIANTATAVSIDATSNTTVLTRNFYHNNAASGVALSASDINDPAGNPLFINPGTFNFYLASGAQAIDRSLGSLADRTNYVALKAQSAIPKSDVFSPDKDLYGQKRVDDPTQAPSGFGGEVFNDLGAVERADQTGGVTKLIVPEDGGVEDLDPLPAVVHIDSPTFFNELRVKFTDVGIGIDDASVNPNGSQFTLTQRTPATGGVTVTLQNNVDYIFAYNANTNEAILTSLTLFPLDAFFTLTVNNSSATGVKDLAGNNLIQNQNNGTVRFDILVTNVANGLPTISDIPDQSTNLGTALPPVPFTIGDAQTAAANLVVTVTSSNTALVPNANIVVGGSGANRMLTITPTINSLGTTTITVTVTDTDGNTASDTFNFSVVPFGLSISDVTIAEGGGSAVFTVSLPSSSSSTINVNFATANGTASAGSDYTATSGTLTFSPGQTSKTITVPILNDSLSESTETFVINLSNATNASIVDGQGQGTITDDDVSLGPKISIGDVTVVEGDTGTQDAVFTVKLSAVSGQPVTVDFATADGTAIAGSDFVTNTGTLTFAPGQTSLTITVAVTGEALYELAESFFVNLSGATNATIGDGQGQGTIYNNDQAPKLSIDDVTVIEGTGNTVDAVFTVSLSTVSGVPVTVQYKTANSETTTSTAQTPEDYTATSGVVTFAAGQTSQTVTVSIVGDLLDELSQTFFVNLTTSTNASIADNQGVGTIVDDDSSPTFSITDVSVTEKTGTSVIAVFTVTLSEVSGLQVGVNYATANDTASSTGDYLAKKGSLLFAPGQLSKTLSISVTGDTRDELDETFFMNLSSPSNAILADNQGVCTIADDDATPTLSINNKTVTEGTGITVNAIFTVKLSAASGLPVTVTYATADSSATGVADYASLSSSLTFAAGQTVKTFAVPVVGDALDELNETYFVNLINPTNATIAIGQGLGTITDNDVAPKLSINKVTVTEGNNGTIDAVFTIKLSAASGLLVAVSYATANGTALAGSDYDSTSGNLTFNPGETTKTITVSVLGDSVHEPFSKTFSLNLSNALNALFSNTQGIGTILDND